MILFLGLCRADPQNRYLDLVQATAGWLAFFYFFLGLSVRGKAAMKRQGFAQLVKQFLVCCLGCGVCGWRESRLL